ncbi:MAG: hypothetical protein LC126_27325 [Bryobacterales bacterium]|nr:hypothetical protein [Bryobacterales bacterium]
MFRGLTPLYDYALTASGAEIGTVLNCVLDGRECIIRRLGARSRLLQTSILQSSKRKEG